MNKKTHVEFIRYEDYDKETRNELYNKLSDGLAETQQSHYLEIYKHEKFANYVNGRKDEYYTDEAVLDMAKKYGFQTFFIKDKNANEVCGLIELATKRNNLWIITLFVKEEFRGKKIGTLGMEFVIAYGKQIKCDGVHLNVVTTNEKALALYRKYGFLSYEKTMCLDLYGQRKING